MQPSERILSLLEHAARNGWTWKTQPVHRHIGSLGSYAVSEFELTKDGESFSLIFTPDWIYMQAEIMPALPEDDPNRLTRWLLHRQNQVFLVKFSVSPEGCVILRADIPEYQRNLLMFIQSLDAVLIYQKEMRHMLAGRQLPVLNTLSEHLLEMPLDHWMPDEQIREYFKRLYKNGWQVADEKKDAHTYVAYYYSQEKTYNIYFSLTAGWAYFQVPLATLDPATGSCSILPTYLMELNEQMYWAKFSLIGARTSHGVYDEVVLTLDMPSDEIDLTLFRHAALTVSYYLDTYYFDLALLTSDADLARLVARHPYSARQSPTLLDAEIWK